MSVEERALWGKRRSDQCEQKSERWSEWPNTQRINFIVILSDVRRDFDGLGCDLNVCVCDLMGTKLRNSLQKGLFNIHSSARLIAGTIHSLASSPAGLTAHSRARGI